MASTSTNKQPLLVDNVLHNVTNIEGKNIPDVDSWGGTNNTNNAFCLVRGNTADGAVIEDIYTIARDTGTYTLVFFLSTEVDYLRPQYASVVGRFQSKGSAIGEVNHYYDMPYVLAPVPAVSTTPQTSSASTSLGGDALKYKALYIPRGKSLWVGVVETVGKAPYVGAQGGWY